MRLGVTLLRVVVNRRQFGHVARLYGASGSDVVYSAACGSGVEKVAAFLSVSEDDRLNLLPARCGVASTGRQES